MTRILNVVQFQHDYRPQEYSSSFASLLKKAPGIILQGQNPDVITHGCTSLELAQRAARAYNPEKPGYNAEAAQIEVAQVIKDQIDGFQFGTAFDALAVAQFLSAASAFKGRSVPGVVALNQHDRYNEYGPNGDRLYDWELFVPLHMTPPLEDLIQRLRQDPLRVDEDLFRKLQPWAKNYTPRGIINSIRDGALGLMRNINERAPGNVDTTIAGVFGHLLEASNCGMPIAAAIDNLARNVQPPDLNFTRTEGVLTPISPNFPTAKLITTRYRDLIRRTS